jgi:hypothetical protein
VFPDVKPEVLNDQTALGQLPNWDSMNSVNLTLQFEAEFGLRLFDRQVVFVGSQRIADVKTVLRDEGAAC